MRTTRFWGYIPLTLSLALLSACGPNLSFSSASSASLTSSSDSPYRDLIVWDGRTFSNTERFVKDRALIGDRLGEVQDRIAGEGREPYYQLQDGDATLLDKGTPLYRVKDSDHIAVMTENGYVLYEPETRQEEIPVYKPIDEIVKQYSKA